MKNESRSSICVHRDLAASGTRCRVPSVGARSPSYRRDVGRSWCSARAEEMWGSTCVAHCIGLGKQMIIRILENFKINPEINPGVSALCPSGWSNRSP